MFDKKTLEGQKVAILATDGFEREELMSPKDALEKAGAKVTIVSPKEGTIKAWVHKDWGDEIEVDLTLEEADPREFDALLLPGGVMNPDALRIEPKAIAFAQSFVDAGKPIAAICHGPWLLTETSALSGRQVTSWPSLKTDLKNAGADWVDREVVVDNGLVTSRKPADLPAFNAKMIEEIQEGTHRPMRRSRGSVEKHPGF